MLENGPENEPLEAFKHNFDTGLKEMLEEAAFMFDIPRAPDPYSMGFDSRTIDDLTPDELEVVQDLIYENLDLTLDTLKEQTVRTYKAQTPVNIRRRSGLIIPARSEINVTVYKTNQSQEGIFIQELLFPDGEKRWFIGPDQNI